ncbi:MAG: molybdopterin molybdotransferase MoeA [Aigarchaeota archaeon]|nr:molybdopterin molybdotransferase MoeA [Candidatus Pelearchaeum maunauluense]
MDGSLRRIRSFTPIEEAVSILVASVRDARRVERVDADASLGRVLATAITAERNYPEYDTSHMDGFALNHRDTLNASEERPARLRIAGSIEAGARHRPELARGAAMRVLTGAPLPLGADTVVAQEEVKLAGDYIHVKRPVRAGENIDPAGADIREGEVLLGAGHRIRPQDLALLHYLGLRWVEVFHRPRVALLVVGDELTDDLEEAARGKVFNTHRRVIEPLTRAAGCEVRYLGIMPDNAELVGQKLREALASHDVILTIGGSSVSEKDATSLALRRIGAERIVQGLAIQPGRVGGFAIANGKPIILLPGLIMSTINVFLFLAYPLLKYMQGLEPTPYHKRLRARLAEDVRISRYVDFKKVVWVRLEERGEADYLCYPQLGESSRMSIPVRSHGFIVINEGVEHVERGAEVVVNLPPT